MLGYKEPKSFICMQRIQGELFLFMDLCGNIVGALGL